jgi:DNA-directed RNA polymerase II subunit RPB2
MLGIATSNIPFPEHNQAPRVVYQAAMCKQAMGVFATNFKTRIDTYSHVLWYPQTPLIRTKNSITMNMNDMPSGINAVVAIMCYSGYNQEDSIMMNQSSIDRGLFRSFFYRAYKDELCQGNQNSKESLCNPMNKNCLGMKLHNYEKLDKDGLVHVGIKVDDNDIIIGKINSGDTENTNKDSSTVVKHKEGGIVDKTIVTVNEQGMKMVKSRVRSTRIPEIGDKFASRHAQKGTIGITYRYEDMPFTAEGIVPDIIVNPHAIPSRMTIGQLIECIYGKKCAVSGTYGDGTAFTNPDPGDIIKALHECGYQKHGEEMLYHGHTGEPLKAKIFIGPTYYQRLKHMVNDKIHSRGRGPIQILTRQPVEGRSRDGGLRFGEMEKDCIISHGASAFLKERLMDQSDAYKTHVCNTCGMFCINDIHNKTKYCKNCNDGNVSDIEIPYACKLLFQELMAANIIPRIKVKD